MFGGRRRNKSERRDPGGFIDRSSFESELTQPDPTGPLPYPGEFATFSPRGQP